jgi:hypothetical protein
MANAGTPSKPPLWKVLLYLLVRIPFERLRWNPFWFGLTALLIAILHGFGAGFGVPLLFWHHDRWTQIFAGAGAGVLIAELCFVSYLLDSDEPWLEQWMPGDHWRELPKYFFTLLIPLVALAIWPACGDADRWPLVAGVAAGVVASSLYGALLMLACYRLDDTRAFRWLDWLLFRPPAPRGPENAVKRGMRCLLGGVRKKRRRAPRWLYAMAGGYVFTLIGCYFLLMARADVVSPALAICILLGVLIRFYGLLVFHFESVYFVALAVVVLWCLVVNGRVEYKHRLHALPYGKAADLRALLEASDVGTAQRAADDPSGESKQIGDAARSSLVRLDDAATLEVAWLGQFPDEKPKLVIVVASGGGIRAAAWTATVLGELESKQWNGSAALGRFPHHVRLVTGASGGVLGAAYYVATLEPPPAVGHSTPAGTPLSTDEITQKIAADSLTHVARSIVFCDIWRLAWPSALPDHDRGAAMESAWEQNTRDPSAAAGSESSPLAQPFVSLAAGEEAGWRPSVVFTPMMVEDGRRLIVSNLNLDGLTRSLGSTVGESGESPKPGDSANEAPPLYSLSAVEFARLFPNAGTFKLSTAARMSASFPYVSPAGELPVTPPRRVVDAGYYDNYGVNLAARWLDAHRNWLRHEAGNVSGIVLIQIRDGVMDDELRAPPATGSIDRFRRLLRRGATGLTTPLEGASSAYLAMPWFRNNEQVQALSATFNDEKHPQFFTTVFFDYADRVGTSLSWCLTPSEFASITGNIKESPNAERIDELVKWWQIDHTQAR